MAIDRCSGRCWITFELMGKLQAALIGFALLLVLVAVWLRFRGGGQRLAVRSVARALSVRDGLGLVRDLKRLNAQWTVIIARLNPGNDSEVYALLLRLRGPHMFNPGLALNVLESECEGFLKLRPLGTMREALVLAVRSMERVTRYGD